VQSPLQKITQHPGTAQGISLWIKRDDLLHPEVCGSKWRKLSAVLPLVRASGARRILSFGGPFSNHLEALSVAGRLWGIPTIGVVRGEHADPDNPTLSVCRENGMTLHLLPKKSYDAGVANLREQYSDAFILPEGGNTPEAVQACSAIGREVMEALPELPPDNLLICVPAGTGCTAAGVATGPQRTLVFPVTSHGFDRVYLATLLPETAAMERVEIVHDYTFGGFARLHLPVVEFSRRFYAQTGILPDPIYTAKTLFGVFDRLEKGHFPPESTVVALHTGGLQGWKGFLQRYGQRHDFSHLTG
jgi:1-aminocyclopropane-1-carboxylate deaminase/D-cysteine desulfhydrase-like pyridoxal-dependent ACC family enzyme